MTDRKVQKIFLGLSRCVEWMDEYDVENYIERIHDRMRTLLPISIKKYDIICKDWVWGTPNAWTRTGFIGMSEHIEIGTVWNVFMAWKMTPMNWSHIYHDSWQNNAGYIRKTGENTFEMEYITFTPDGKERNPFGSFDSLLQFLRLQRIFPRIDREIWKIYNSYKDRLTDLPNRKFIENLQRDTFPSTSEEIPKNKDKKYNLHFIDIGNFKEYNDTYGYDIGDAVLREVGSILDKWTRKNDRACRWWGDEFIIFQDISGHNALRSVYEGKRLRERLQENLQEASKKVYEQYREKYDRLSDEEKMKYPTPEIEVPVDFMIKLDIGIGHYEIWKTYEAMKQEAISQMKSSKSPEGRFSRWAKSLEELINEAKRILFDTTSTPATRKIATEFLAKSALITIKSISVLPIDELDHKMTEKLKENELGTFRSFLERLQWIEETV